MELNIFTPINILQILVALWLIRTLKFTFFYLYLWQLKEYHLGRFLDHFRTEKGKGLLLSQLNFGKVLLLIYFFNFPYHLSYLSQFHPLISPVLNYFFPVLILIIYFFEGLKYFWDLLKKKAKFPVLTKKMLFLIIVVIALEAVIILSLFYLGKSPNSFTFWLLLFDLLGFLVISAIVLVLQPLTVILRWRIIQRAKQKRGGHKDLLVIGVTGSYGKTSTKEFLYTILSKKFNVLKTKEHQNSEIGIAQCILNDLEPGHEIFIAEMGAYGRGRIKLLSDIIKPKIGILAGINEQHLALFGSQENIIKAKYELFEALPENGLAVFNGDNEYCLDLYKKTEKPKRIISSRPQEIDLSRSLLDIWAENIIVQRDYLFFRACDQAGCQDVKAYLSGAHFVSNLLATILVAKELGMENKEIAESILEIKSPPKTMNIFEGIKDIVIIDDSYSANPEGVFAALDYLKIYGGKKMIILPSLIELGKVSKEVHQAIGEKIARICDAAIVTTKDYFQEIGKGFLKGGGKRESVLFSDNPKEIYEIIDRLWDPGDVILLEGRIPEKIINYLIEH